jgi:hypothetical protein
MSATDQGTILAVGWETEFVGTAVQYTPDGILRVAVYDLVAILAKLANESRAACKDHSSDCDHITDAIELAEFNILGAYIGPGMPVFLTRKTFGEWQEEVKYESE